MLVMIIALPFSIIKMTEKTGDTPRLSGREKFEAPAA